MKLSKLSKLIKKNNGYIARFIDKNGTMWIGFGFAIFPLYDMPRLLIEAQILTLLDVPLSQHDTYNVYDIVGKQKNNLDSYIDIKDTAGFKPIVDGFPVVCGDDTLICLKTEYGIKFIKQSYLDVIDTVSDNNILYYKCIDNTIIISNGFITVGIIMCYDAITEKLVLEYKKIYDIMLEALEEKKKREKETEVNKIAQLEFEMFPDTE